MQDRVCSLRNRALSWSQEMSEPKGTEEGNYTMSESVSREEFERVQAQAAIMREVIEDVFYLKDGKICYVLHERPLDPESHVKKIESRYEKLQTVLSSDIGKGWLSPVQAEAFRAELRAYERAAVDAMAYADILDASSLADLNEGPLSDALDDLRSCLITLLRGKDRPGPWAFDKVLAERNALIAEVAHWKSHAAEHGCMDGDAIRGMAVRVEEAQRTAAVFVKMDELRADNAALRQRLAMHAVDPGGHSDPIGPISPRRAIDEAEGEAIAPTDFEYDYCPATWKKNEKLLCTRVVGHNGDHVVGKDGLIIARWPQEYR